MLTWGRIILNIESPTFLSVKEVHPMMNRYSPNHTSLGLPETAERVLAYAFFWLSGLLLLLFEKNPNVRHHARQSVAVFGTLSIIGFLLWFIGGFLHFLPLIGGILAYPFALLGDLNQWISIALWLGLMLAALVSPRFQLPFTRRANRYLP